MANKEKIDYLLLDVRDLERLIAGMRDVEIYPVSFFSQTFELTQKILKGLHALEAAQIEALRKQMEEHEAILKDLPRSIPADHEFDRSAPVQPASGTNIETEKDEKTPRQDVADNKNPVEIISSDCSIEITEKKIIPVEEEPCTVNQVVPPSPPHADKSIQNGTPLGEKIISSNLSINEIVEKRKLTDFRKAFSLNDRFYFRRELFNGNEGRMNQVIEHLNNLLSYEESVVYLKQELEWNLDDQAVADFVKLIEKRFA